MKKLFLVSQLILAGVAMAAQTSGKKDPAFEIVRTEVRELNAMELQSEITKAQIDLDDFKSKKDDVDDAVTIFDKLWLIGKKLYPIIKSGSAVINVKKNTWSVLPAGTKNASALSQWQAPKYSGYEYNYYNGFDDNVVSVRYVTTFAYGGKTDDNKGAYLAHVSIVPSSIHVQWGFKLDVEVQAQEALNLGTAADPVAGFSYDVVVHVTSGIAGITVSNFMDTVHYFMDGKGNFKTVE